MFGSTLALLLGLTPTVDAQSDLSWTAPPGCPQHDAVRARIEQILGEPLGEARSVVVHADGTVRPGAAGFELTLTISSATGQRTRVIAGPRCEALSEFAAVFTAVAIDPGVAGRLGVGEGGEGLDAEAEPPVSGAPSSAADGSGSASAEAASETGDSSGGEAGGEAVVEPAARTEVPDPSPPDESPTEPGPVRSPSRGLSGALRLAGGVNLGSLPAVTGLLSASGSLRWRWLRVDAGVVHRLSRRARSSEGLGGSADLWITAGGLGLCGVPAIAPVEFPICGGLEVGAITGRGRAITDPKLGRAPWVAARAGAGVIALPVERVGLGVDIGAVVPLVRPEFEIDGVGEVFAVSPLGMDATLLVEVRFP